MKDRQGRSSNISVGDVKGHGIVIGHGSSVSVGQSREPAQAEAITMLDELIRILASQQDSVGDAEGLRGSAEAAKAELQQHSPRWNIVKGLLRGISAGLAGVSVLAETASNIETVITHLPR